MRATAPILLPSPFAHEGSPPVDAGSRDAAVDGGDDARPDASFEHASHLALLEHD